MPSSIARCLALCVALCTAATVGPVQECARAEEVEVGTTDASIAAVEQGLIEIASPAALFGIPADAAEESPTYSLRERMAHHKVPGVGIAVIEDGEIAWARGYGVLSADRDTPVTTESLFEAGSTSKFVTAVLLLHYVEQGVLDLDTDVNEYLRSWEVPQNEFTVEQKVTLRLLLTHRAGLPATNFEDTAPEDAPSIQQVLTGRPAAGNEPAVPVRPLNDEWVYSNLGCIMIQLILEDTLERPFPELAREVIFEPLGMASSTFQYPLPPEMAARETMPHDGHGVAHSPLMNYTAFGHAGLMTTPGDLAKLIVELLRSYKGESDKVLSSSMTREFLAKQFDIEPSPFGVAISEGLGVFLRGEGDALMFLHPGGNTPGANCFPLGLPEVGKGAVIMTNGLNGEVLFMELLASIMREYDWPR
jgi:CubicO group peptidase (beta-lactamase class C family)